MDGKKTWLALPRWGLIMIIQPTKNWEASVNLISDIKTKAYNYWILRLGVAKFL